MLIRALVLLFTVCLPLLPANAGSSAVMEITVTTPPAYETIGPPNGYHHCELVHTQWVNGFLIPAHRECQYQDNGSISRWVAGYWGCQRQYWGNNHCRHWSWVSNRWVRPHANEYPHRHAQNHSHENYPVNNHAHRDVQPHTHEDYQSRHDAGHHEHHHGNYGR